MLTAPAGSGLILAMRPFRRMSAVLTVASLLSLFAIVPAAASAARTVPVPRAAGPFKIGAASSPVSVALEPNGDRVVVFDASTSDKIVVCVVKPAARRCSHTTRLATPAGDETLGNPQVFVPKAGHVVLLQQICCHLIPVVAVSYTSTNGGKTFDPAASVGKLGVSAGTLIRNRIVWTLGGDSAVHVESTDLGDQVPGNPAKLLARIAADVGVGQYKRGVLIASDPGAAGPVSVEYGRPHKDFNSASNYRRVATFAHESLKGLSGNALLTLGPHHLLLRLFDGTRFGPAHVVPHAGLTGFDVFNVVQDPSSRIHVFTDESGNGYHVLELSTSNGKTWTRPARLGVLKSVASLNGALNSHGKGLLTGYDAHNVWGITVG